MTRHNWGTANTSPPLALVDVRSMFVPSSASSTRHCASAPGHRAVQQRQLRRGQGPTRPTLGVQMGDPWFQLRDKPHLADLVAKSSNYEYGAFSSRFHETVATISATTETYSIDEGASSGSLADRPRPRAPSRPAYASGPACPPRPASGRPKRWPRSPNDTPSDSRSSISPWSRRR